MLLRGRLQQPTSAPPVARYAAVAPSITPYGAVTNVPYDGVPLTIEDMRRMVRDAITREGSPALRKLVEEITAQIRAKDRISEVAAIYYWCMKNIRYLFDPVHVEYLTNPLMVLQPTASDRLAGRRAKQEDCEAISTTIAAMAMSIGVPCEFVTIAMNGGGFHHVFTVANVKGVKLVLDPVAGPDVKEMLRKTVKHQVWPIEPVRVEGQSGWGVMGVGPPNLQVFGG